MCVSVCMCVCVKGDRLVLLDSQLTALFAAGKGNHIKLKATSICYNTENEPRQSRE